MFWRKPAEFSIDFAVQIEYISWLFGNGMSRPSKIDRTTKVLNTASLSEGFHGDYTILANELDPSNNWNNITISYLRGATKRSSRVNAIFKRDDIAQELEINSDKLSFVVFARKYDSLLGNTFIRYNRLQKNSLFKAEKWEVFRDEGPMPETVILNNQTLDRSIKDLYYFVRHRYKAHTLAFSRFDNGEPGILIPI